jgi:hypothetical protein
VCCGYAFHLTNMSKRVREQLPVLKKLARCCGKQHCKLVHAGGDELLKCLSECAYNVINKNVPLNDAQLNKLSKHKKIVRELACRKSTLKSKRRKVLNQKGGFLLALLAPVITALVEHLIQ